MTAPLAAPFGPATTVRHHLGTDLAAMSSCLVSRTCEYARCRSLFTSLPNGGRLAALPFRLLRRPVLYFANASSFLTDFTPATPRAISEALALAPMVAT
jgi:hypothetical protein